MKDVEENEDESKQPSFVVGSLAEACGIPFDPNEPTQRVGERANMAKNYPVGDGKSTICGPAETTTWTTTTTTTTTTTLFQPRDERVFLLRERFEGRKER